MGSTSSEEKESEIPSVKAKYDTETITESVEEFNTMWQKALLQDLEINMSDNVKIVRIFTSSTFTDTSVERNTLMERVYPRLKSYCQERGYDFQVVDMRWGVRDESTDDHMTTELCMRELRACQKLSTGPNFITFLGQKYGYRPFPAKIAASEFEKLLGVVENEDDLQLLKHWFWRDDNAVPAQYLLQPITSLLPHYRDYENKDLRKKASNEWWSAFERIQVVLRKAADGALKEDDRHRYHMSVTEDELRRGIITAETPEKHCFWFKRIITDLNENSHKPNAGKFLDKSYGVNDSAIDESAQSLLNSLREEELPNMLPADNVIQYNVAWSDEGINLEASVEHAQYIDNLCTNVYDVLTRMIQEGIKDRETHERKDPLADEILQHALFCQKKGEACRGREEFLHSVEQSLVANSNKHVVILHGESGCGKTSIMAKIAVEGKKWLEDKSAVVVVRFIGTSPESSSIRPLLRSICQQLYKTTGKDLTEIPEDLMALVEFFPKCLEEVSSFRPVVLIIDSLDQLPAEDGGRRLDWLPWKLPDDVYLVLSTLPGSEYGCLPNLKTVFPESCFKEVPDIPVSQADKILEIWLSSSRRTLVDLQKKVVLEAFQKCPLPLFLKLSFDEACRWNSYTKVNETKLASSVKGIISDLFERVERRHGRILVNHALAYLTASKNGLTEPELEDVLSLDDEVLNDVYQYWTPPARRLPPLLWIRIRSDIEDYLTERGNNGSRVVFWHHRQFVEVARERYLGAQKVAIHSKLAEFFLGKWSTGTAKPYINNEGKQLWQDRMVAKQPLIFDSANEKAIFNLRKLNELPHHLLHSNELQRLKEEALCNFEFLLAKLRATSLESVLDDFSASLGLYPDDVDVIELEKTLQLSSVALKGDNNQLASQLLGRLHPRLGIEAFPGINHLLLQAYSSSVPCLIPSHKCLTSPGGTLVSSLKLPEQSITKCCGFSCDGKTAYIVGTTTTMAVQLLIVNLQNGKFLRRLTLPQSLGLGLIWMVQGSNVKQDLLLLSGWEHIFLLNVSSGQVVHKLAALTEKSQYNPMPPVSFVDNDMRIVAITDEDLKIWTVEDGQLVHRVDIGKIPTDEEFGSLGAAGYWAAFSVHGTKSFKVLNTRTGVQLREVVVFKAADACSIDEIKVTLTKKVVVTSSEKNNLRLYDLHTGNLIREIPQFKINKGLLRLQLTADGTKAVSVSDYEILITNLEDGTVHKTLKSKSFGTLIIHIGFFTKDGKFGISIAHDEVIRIYNLEHAITENQNVVQRVSNDSKAVSSVDSIKFLSPGTDDRHVIATATVNSSSELLLWDTWTGTKVRALQMTQEMPPSAICMTSTYRAVGYIHDQFLHFKVFDFKTGNIERCLKGKASKRMEAFGAIDEKRLIAFSRGRRNLKVWDINNGQLVQQHKFGQQHRLEDMLISKNGKSVVCAQMSQIVMHTEKPLSLIFLNTDTGIHKFLEMKDAQLLLWNSSIADDGSYLVCLTQDFIPVLWDLSTGELLHKLLVDEHPAAIATAISTARNVVLTGQSDGDIKAWDIKSGRILYTLDCEAADSIFVAQNGKVAFSNYRYRNSNIDAWDLNTGLRLATFTSDWKPERLTISGSRLVVAKADGPELMTLRLHIPGYEEKLPEEKSPFEGCPVEGELKPSQKSPEADDEDEDADDDIDVTDIQRTQFTRKAVHARPNVVIGGGSVALASKNVFMSEKVFSGNFS